MTMEPTASAEVKACCAAAYSHDAVALLLGESYHPGGLALTRRLASAVGLQPGWRVVDVASGPGTTARLLAADYAATVDGVELGESAVERARSAAGEAAFPAGPGSIEEHDDAIAQMAEQIEARLTVLRMSAAGQQQIAERPQLSGKHARPTVLLQRRTARRRAGWCQYLGGADDRLAGADQRLAA